MNTKRLKDLDFIVQAVLMVVWGWSLLRQADVFGKHAGMSLSLLFPAGVMWLWLLADSWRRWRDEKEDERVRQLILTAGYISRQVAMVALFGLIMIGSRFTLGPTSILLAMALVLVGSDALARRYLGLKDEELQPERSEWESRLYRVTWLAAAGFGILVLGYMLYAGSTVRDSLMTDPSGWGTEKPGSPEQAAKAKAAGVTLTQKDLTPPPEPQAKAPTGRVIIKRSKNVRMELH